jgi:hypothetical protein
MSGDEASQEGLREKLSARGEETLGELADALLENSYFKNALEAALGARDRALGAQKAAMGALNLPSADEIERLTRRVRSLSGRLESIEDGADEGGAGIGSDRLAAIESRLDELARDVAALREQLAAEDRVSTDQERLKVSEAE